MNKCIFCKSVTNSFDRLEHIIPESLGGDLLAPPGLICDKCNEYFGTTVEKKALDTPILSFMRAFMSIPNKRNSPRVHQGVQFAIHGQSGGIAKLELPISKHVGLLAKGTGSFRIPAYAGLPAICRLMLKIGIELIATAPDMDVFSNEFDEARIAARFPRRNEKWWLACGYTHPDDMNLTVGMDELGAYVTQSIYEFRMYRDTESSSLVLDFQYGFARYIVPINRIAYSNFSNNIVQYNLTNPSSIQFEPLEFDITKLDE